MKVYDYYNPEFVSFGTKGNYAKVAIEIIDDDESYIGMFSVLFNKDTIKEKIQIYDYKSRSRDRNLFAGKKDNAISGKENLNRQWNNLIDSDRRSLHICELVLTKAFGKFCMLLKKNNHELKIEQMKFIGEKLNEIDTQFSCKLLTNNYEDTGGESNSSRNIIKMIKIKNAEGLTEFINGNFHPIIRTENFNNKTYFIIANDKGEERALSQDRVEEVNVFENFLK